MQRKRVNVEVKGVYVVSLDAQGSNARTEGAARIAVMKMLGLKNSSEIEVTAGDTNIDKLNKGKPIIIRVDE